MLIRIEELRPRLRKSEQKVADLVLAQPNTVLGQSISVLAQAAGVSEPTVIRFCRAVGCKGFQDFKLRLAQDLASSVRYFHGDVAPGDPPADLLGKVFDRAIGTLTRVRNGLSAERLEQAIDTLVGAERVEIYGVGASSFVAFDAQHKFFLLGIPAAAYSDPHFQAMSASTLQPGSVVLAISESGRSLDLLRAVEIALKAGAQVIAVTASASPLAKRCSTHLAADLLEESSVYAPLTAHIAHLTIIDVLAAGVAVRRGPDLLDHLEKTQRLLRGKLAGNGSSSST